MLAQEFPGCRTLIDAIDHAAPGSQHPPQLVEYDEAVPARFQAGVREHL